MCICTLQIISIFTSQGRITGEHVTHFDSVFRHFGLIATAFCCYRPQRSCGKVMSLLLSVSNSVHRLVSIPACTTGHMTRGSLSGGALCPGGLCPQRVSVHGGSPGTPSPPGHPCTVARAVRILLECILVFQKSSSCFLLHEN